MSTILLPILLLPTAVLALIAAFFSTLGQTHAILALLILSLFALLLALTLLALHLVLLLNPNQNPALPPESAE